MKKRLFTAALLMTAAWSADAQTVTLDKKKNTIAIDGVTALKYTKNNRLSWSFFDKDDNEIVFFKVEDNGTPAYIDDDYMVINFLNENTKTETNDFSHVQAVFNINKTIEKSVVWLLKEKVLNTEGYINPDKVAVFHSKYDQNITNRTIRY